MKVAFIGLGSIGQFMARRLVRVGFEVTGCDFSPKSLEAFDEPGAKRSADPIAAVRGADIAGICVLNDGQVEALAGDGRLFEALGKGRIAVIHSTVSPDLPRRLAKVAAQYGVELIDAGVSPGGPTIGEGKSSIFVGGAVGAVERARPYLEAFGTLAHLGPLGRGLEGKLLNNLTSTAGYGLAVSILSIARELGFDQETLRQAMLLGSAQSYALQVTPGLLRPHGHGAVGTLEGLYDTLKKDTDHGAELAGRDNPHTRVLMTAVQAMLDALQARAKEEGQ